MLEIAIRERKQVLETQSEDFNKGLQQHKKASAEIWIQDSQTFQGGAPLR